MASATDLASAIGTWVAVGLALLAAGIVAPILVWRASRTERSRALAALDAGLAESAGFVTNGVRLGANIRLFQRVQAPVLTRDPDIARKTIHWHGSHLIANGRRQQQPSPESSSWVQLGHVIQAYSICFRTADVLVIEDGHAVLPVINSWVFVLGLVGRFGQRVDEGKWPKRRPKGIRFQQAPAGRRMTDLARQMRPPTPGWMTSEPRWAETNDFELFDSYDDRTLKLFGLVGKLSVDFRRLSSKNKKTKQRSSEDQTAGQRRERSRVSFHAHDVAEVGNIGGEALRIDQLFWLSVGCLPMSDGRVLSLEDAQPMQLSDGSEAESSSQENNIEWDMDGKSPAVRFDDFVATKPPRRAHAGGDHTSPTYVISPPVATDGQANHRGFSSSLNVPRKFQMGVTEARAESLIGLAELVGAEDGATETLSLEEVLVPENEISALKADSRSTYVPHYRPWIRLTPTLQSGYASQAWFLDKRDAQMLARALVELPVCAHGVLVYKATDSVCRNLLVGAAEALPRLLARLGSELVTLELEPAESQRLEVCMWNLLTCMTPYKYTRTFSLSLFEVDHLLESVCVDELVVKMAVQALTITSPEFRDLISQSVRNIKACMPSTLTLDFASSTLDVLSVMGVVQKFPVSIDVLVRDPAVVDRTSNRKVPYRNVVLLALKAAVRSAFLQTSLDSQPLYQMVLGIDEVAYVQ